MPVLQALWVSVVWEPLRGCRPLRLTATLPLLGSCPFLGALLSEPGNLPLLLPIWWSFFLVSRNSPTLVNLARLFALCVRTISHPWAYALEHKSQQYLQAGFPKTMNIVWMERKEGDIPGGKNLVHVSKYYAPSKLLPSPVQWVLTEDICRYQLEELTPVGV